MTPDTSEIDEIVGFETIYNMSGYDFKRINEIMSACNQNCFLAKTEPSKVNLCSYSESLWIYYMELAPYFYKQRNKEKGKKKDDKTTYKDMEIRTKSEILINNSFKVIRKELLMKKLSPSIILEACDDIHFELNHHRHTIGLSFKTKKVISDRSKHKRAFGRKRL